jgi:hypothetical protein
MTTPLNLRINYDKKLKVRYKKEFDELQIDDLLIYIIPSWPL